MKKTVFNDVEFELTNRFERGFLKFGFSLSVQPYVSSKFYKNSIKTTGINF